MDKEAQEKVTKIMATVDELSQRLESYLPITSKDSLRVAKELYDNGYRKLSEKPPLLSDEGIYDADMSAVTAYIKEHSGKDSWDGSECEMSGRRAIAQTQWDIWNKAIYG